MVAEIGLSYRESSSALADVVVSDQEWDPCGVGFDKGVLFFQKVLRRELAQEIRKEEIAKGPGGREVGWR